MATVKSKKTIYEFDLSEVKSMFAKELEVPEKRISVDYVIQEIGGDCMDRFPGVKVVTKVSVTVDNS